MFCSKCGTKLDDTAIFCSNCGERQKSSQSVSKAETANTAVSAKDIKISDDYVWWLIIIPAAMWTLGYFLKIEQARIGILVLFILMCWLTYKDMQLFERAGLPKVNVVWVILPPIYFYKRAAISGQTLKNFWRSLTSIGVICAFIMFPGIFADFQPLEKRITMAAPQVVNQILSERFQNPAKCKEVTITRRVSDNKYEGLAHLDNGNTAEI